MEIAIQVTYCYGQMLSFFMATAAAAAGGDTLVERALFPLTTAVVVIGKESGSLPLKQKMMEVMFLQLIEGSDRNIVDDDGQENHRTSAKGKSKGYFYPSLVKSGNLHFN